MYFTVKIQLDNLIKMNLIDKIIIKNIQFKNTKNERETFESII